ncbi:hypothetical protein KSP39_PZI009387 [Platanthera zijinensis]|uniref:Uncharacterized protein n=1 Tax=Platanthera zijinensis TaxID=2320716 RepID=A0AAP0BJZ4_9ASPA
MKTAPAESRTADRSMSVQRIREICVLSYGTPSAGTPSGSGDRKADFPEHRENPFVLIERRTGRT